MCVCVNHKVTTVTGMLVSRGGLVSWIVAAVTEIKVVMLSFWSSSSSPGQSSVRLGHKYVDSLIIP